MIAPFRMLTVAATLAALASAMPAALHAQTTAQSSLSTSRESLSRFTFGIDPHVGWLSVTDYGVKGHAQQSNAQRLGRRGFDGRSGNRLGIDVQAAYSNDFVTLYTLTAGVSNSWLYQMQFPAFDSFNRYGYKNFGTQHALVGIRRYLKSPASPKRVFGELQVGVERVNAGMLRDRQTVDSTFSAVGPEVRLTFGSQQTIPFVGRMDIALHVAHTALGRWSVENAPTNGGRVRLWNIGLRTGARYRH